MKLNFNIFKLRPKDNSRVRQSYWGNEKSKVPVWKQKNDDNKLGRKELPRKSISQRIKENKDSGRFKAYEEAQERMVKKFGERKPSSKAAEDWDAGWDKMEQ